jgi:hypothetical protein
MHEHSFPTRRSSDLSIASVQEFVELAAALPTQRPISLRIVRDGRPLFVAFRLNQ